MVAVLHAAMDVLGQTGRLDVWGGPVETPRAGRFHVIEVNGAGAAMRAREHRGLWRLAASWLHRQRWARGCPASD